MAYTLLRDDSSSSIIGPTVQFIIIGQLLTSFNLLKFHEKGTYTTITFKEMDIPLLCPANYNYTSPLVKSACQICSANLIFMWVTGVILALPFLAFYDS
ncbi:23195_t:CDS:2 [Racocetra persica]|uniref:23195_t:CDS:1 n=1 Tax=Racocetra persica TaxID=160502 RepID=A0ACA9KGH3_9GLOM|nr:23195_t:CDS:2 [Racocetra persica]